jgi:hypothetical protein
VEKLGERVERKPVEREKGLFRDDRIFIKKRGAKGMNVSFISFDKRHKLNIYVFRLPQHICSNLGGLKSIRDG